MSQRISAPESIDTHIGLLAPLLALSELDVVPIEFRFDDHFFSTLWKLKAMTMVISRCVNSIERDLLNQHPKCGDRSDRNPLLGGLPLLFIFRLK